MGDAKHPGMGTIGGSQPADKDTPRPGNDSDFPGVMGTTSLVSAAVMDLIEGWSTSVLCDVERPESSARTSRSA